MDPGIRFITKKEIDKILDCAWESNIDNEDDYHIRAYTDYAHLKSTYEDIPNYDGVEDTRDVIIRIGVIGGRFYATYEFNSKIELDENGEQCGGGEWSDDDEYEFPDKILSLDNQKMRRIYDYLIYKRITKQIYYWKS